MGYSMYIKGISVSGLLYELQERVGRCTKPTSEQCYQFYIYEITTWVCRLTELAKLK